jgi:hypothetical protein
MSQGLNSHRLDRYSVIPAHAGIHHEVLTGNRRISSFGLFSAHPSAMSLDQRYAESGMTINKNYSDLDLL